jgi:hypothetical protein
MDRRIEPRLDCADDVTLNWIEKAGPREQQGLLLNISRSGARVHAQHRIPVGAKVALSHPGGTFIGTITHCLARRPNHVLGISFAPGHVWSRQQFWPKGAKGLGPAPKTA